MSKDKRIDDYISKAQPFAQPILSHLRELVHTACPDVVETIKWGMPSFEYKGPYFGIASFKKHCVAVFWKAKLIIDPKGYLGERKNQGGEAMGHLGCITSLKDLPPDKVLVGFLKQAKKLNDDGIKVIRKPAVRKPLAIPKILSDALSKNKKAGNAFMSLSPSHKREYVEWITEAKTEPVKSKRVRTTIELLSEGKSRNRKYVKK